MNKFITILRESSLARFLIPLSIMLIGFGIVLFVIQNKNKDFIPIEATVTRAELSQEAYIDVDDTYHEATYTIYVKYTVDGKEYEGSLPELPKYESGDKIKITYNPEDPSQISQRVGYIIPMAMVIGGFITLIVGVLNIVKTIKKYKAMSEQEKDWAKNE